ncbi:hypothetical protein EON83_11015 [bacterium]|nr:MAG: hypothetical protein EON83_11015 [bacterium]
MSQKSLFPPSSGILLNMPTKRDKHPPPRRRLRHFETLPGDIHIFGIYSLTQVGYALEHKQEADLQTGALRCSCPDFKWRRARFEPTVGDPRHICKHLGRVLDWLLRKKLLHGREVAVRVLMEQMRPCYECGVADAEYGLCDSRGVPLDGFICRACHERIREEREI